MCTLVVLHRCTPGSELWIAANRDEFHERPAEPPALRVVAGGEPVVTPLDRRAGGAWWGVNRAGVFAAVTNRPAAQPDPARRSRGRLVLDALAAPSARAAADAASAAGTGAYNPFNLVVADAREAFAIVYDGSPRLAPLAPGVHVIGNADPDARDVPKVRRTLERAERLAAGPPERLREGLADLCRGHEVPAEPRACTCVHLGAYGTRSSTLLSLGSDGGLLHHADGPPCTTAYRDYTPLLAELGLAAGLRPGETAARKAS